MKKLLIIGTMLTLSAMLFASGEITISSPGGNGIGTYVELGGKDVLVSQIPDSTTAPGHSVQLDSVYPFESDVCDDITVPAGDAWQIDSIKTWWNNWSTWTSWSHVPNFHVCFYPDSTGFSQPCDSPIVEVVVEAVDYTAYGTNPYSVIIDMTSYGLTVPEGTWWIEVQPSNSFGTNGQTGIQEQVGIGNGQESYNRFPLLGTNVWTTATVTFGSAYEMGLVIWGTVPVQLFCWDFEDGWQGWTHTSDSTFPAAWGVVDADQGHSSYICPDAGDSSMWIDSDAVGSGNTQCDTAISPAFASFPETYLKWAYSFNQIGSDTFRVIMGTWSSGVLTWTDVADYTSDEYGAWDSTDVSALVGDSFHVGFYYYGDWSWYAAFDNVGPVDTLGIEETPIEMPQVFNYRMLSTNPIANSAVIEFALPVNGSVNFTVYDVTGRTILVQNHGVLNAGVHSLTWNRNDNSGRQVAAGSYFFRLEAAGNVATGKFVVTE